MRSLIILASLCAVTPALAVDVRAKAEIEAQAAVVCGKIGGFCAIKDWHPVIAKCEEATAGGVTQRTLTTKDGGVIKETLTAQTATSYSYSIDESPLPVKNYTATLAVTPDADDKDEINVVWTSKFDAVGDEAAAKKVIAGIFKTGMDNIKKTMK